MKDIERLEEAVEINTRNVNNVTVVDISGSLDTLTSGPASKELTRIAQASSNVLVNFENLEFISSAGLRILLTTAKQLQGLGGALKLCGAKGVVKEVMEIAGFGELLDLHDSENDALDAF